MKFDLLPIGAKFTRDGGEMVYKKIADTETFFGISNAITLEPKHWKGCRNYFKPLDEIKPCKGESI